MIAESDGGMVCPTPLNYWRLSAQRLKPGLKLLRYNKEREDVEALSRNSWEGSILDGAWDRPIIWIDWKTFLRIVLNQFVPILNLLLKGFRGRSYHFPEEMSNFKSLDFRATSKLSTKTHGWGCPTGYLDTECECIMILWLFWYSKRKFEIWVKWKRGFRRRFRELGVGTQVPISLFRPQISPSLSRRRIMCLHLTD